jgi:hypothetical protein
MPAKIVDILRQAARSSRTRKYSTEISLQPNGFGIIMRSAKHVVHQLIGYQEVSMSKADIFDLTMGQMEKSLEDAFREWIEFKPEVHIKGNYASSGVCISKSADFAAPAKSGGNGHSANSESKVQK